MTINNKNSLKTSTFPSVSLPITDDRLPVEVTLISQLSVGTGSSVITRSMEKQRHHDAYIDALDEPSTKIGDIHCKQDDHSSLYTFALERQGHPFHRHAGNRTFMAISGSAGTLLRFSLVSDAEMQENSASFLEKLHQITIPPDCLFTVRFGGQTWHQFLPLPKKTMVDNTASHPALFAISCHTDELSGIDNHAMQQAIKENQASIPMLTEVLPDHIQQTLDSTPWQHFSTTQLALRTAPTSAHEMLCKLTRHIVGRLKMSVMSALQLEKLSGYVH